MFGFPGIRRKAKLEIRRDSGRGNAPQHDEQDDWLIGARIQSKPGCG